MDIRLREASEVPLECWGRAHIEGSQIHGAHRGVALVLLKSLSRRERSVQQRINLQNLRGFAPFLFAYIPRRHETRKRRKRKEGTQTWVEKLKGAISYHTQMQQITDNNNRATISTQLARASLSPGSTQHAQCHKTLPVSSVFPPTSTSHLRRSRPHSSSPLSCASSKPSRQHTPPGGPS